PVQGQYRYRDQFQILPVPRDAPRPGFLATDHPFLVEFSFPDTSSPVLRNIRRNTRGRELQLIMNGLLQPSIKAIGTMAKYYWVLPPSDNPQSWRSVFAQE